MGQELESIFSYNPTVSSKIHNFFNHYTTVSGLHKFVFAFHTVDFDITILNKKYFYCFSGNKGVGIFMIFSIRKRGFGFNLP